MTIGRLTIGTSLRRTGARVFTKHKQMIISALCPTGMGGGRGGRGLSVHRRAVVSLQVPSVLGTVR